MTQKKAEIQEANPNLSQEGYHVEELDRCRDMVPQPVMESRRFAKPGSTLRRRVAVMTKADIIDNIYEKVGFTRAEIAKIVESVFDIMKETVQREDKIVISGFGVFATRTKRARRGRNPQTGSDLQISPRRILTFKPSPVLNASVNRATGEIEAEAATQKEG